MRSKVLSDHVSPLSTTRILGVYDMFTSAEDAASFGHNVPPFDVIVVGGGPVGAATALLIARHGWTVAVIEKFAQPYALPRAVHFDDETARILQACRLGDVLGQISEPGDVYEWQNGTGDTLLRFGTEGRGPSGWPYANMFHQPDLEEHLNKLVIDHPIISLVRGAEVIEIEQDDDGVDVTITRSGETGSAPFTTTLSAQYVVGCDGANSTVRDLMDIEMDDHGYFFDWLVVDVEMTSRRRFQPTNLQVCDPRRPTTVVSGGPGRRRWEFMCLPGETLEALDDDHAAWELLRAWDVTPANARLVRHAGYRFQARWATTWRKGRVFLAGDAAHQTPPFAGQGLCAGLHDAANLAWKLDQVFTHGENSELLDTYQQERLPHVATVIGLAMELGKIICVLDADEAAARDASLVPLAADGALTPPPAPLGLEAGLLETSSPGAGELCVQGTITLGMESGLFDNVLSVGWRLINIDDTPVSLPKDLDDWFISIGSGIVEMGPGGDVRDDDGVYHYWMQEHGVRVVLQRPDWYVFGTRTSSADAVSLVSELQRQLGAASDD